MTAEQRAASDPARSAWVTASAGAGKTKTLTDRVTRLILSGASPSSILCVTFTKAAAAEMLDRMEALFRRMVSATDEAMPNVAPFPEAEGLSPAFVRRLAFEALERPPRALTLHAFAQSLLSRFPEESGYAPGLGFADENEAEIYFGKALAHVLTDPASMGVSAGSVRAALAEAENETNLKDRLRPFLARAAEIDVQGEAEADALMRRTLNAPEGERSAALYAARALPPRGENAEALKEDARLLARSSAVTDQKLGTALADALYALDGQGPSEALGKTYAALFFTKAGDPLKKMCGKPFGERHPETALRLEREQSRLIQVLDGVRALACLERGLALLTLGSAVARAYEELKREANVMDFNDMIGVTAALLGGDEAAAVLYETEKRAAHLLLDEAQDTSPVQWDVISKLTEERFGGAPSDNPAERRTLFVVGDEKQSIYRFQGADRERYLLMRRTFEGLARAAHMPYDDIPMRRSFRCAPAVLRFTDAAFADPARAAALTEEAEGVRHEAARSESGGSVTLYPLLRQGADEPSDEDDTEDAPRREEEEAPTGWILPEERGSKPAPGDTTARYVAALTLRLLQDSRRTASRPKGLRPQDVMILLQKREPLNQALRRAFADLEIPVALPDRFEPARHQAAQDLLAYLTCASAPPGDDFSLAVLLRSPLFAFPDDKLERLCVERGEDSLRAALERAAQSDDSDARSAVKRLLDAGDYAARHGPFRFFVRAMYEEGHLAMMHERFGSEADEAAKHFLHMAESYESSAETPTHAGFVREAREKTFSVKREPGGEEAGVRILTVHASKGLQSPVVILPDMADVKRTRDRAVFTQEGVPLFLARQSERCEAEKQAADHEKRAEEAEAQRLFYVAITRAQDELHMLGCLSARRKTIPEDSRYVTAETALRALGAREEEDGRLVLQDGGEIG